MKAIEAYILAKNYATALVDGIHYVKATYAEMLAISSPADGSTCLVVDASGDPTVISGWARYQYILSTTTWQKYAESESLDLTAADISFDNTGTGFTAIQVQEALNEIMSLQSQINTDIYIDGNRTDTYTEDGSLMRPFITFGAALTAMEASSATGFTLHFAYGSYDEGSTAIAFPDKPIHIFGNSSTLITTGGITVSNADFLINDLNITADITFSATATGRVVISNSIIVGSIVANGFTDIMTCQISGGTITINTTAEFLLRFSINNNVIISTGFCRLINVDMKFGNTSWLVNSTAGTLQVLNSEIINTNYTYRQYAINCTNDGGAITPNIFVNVNCTIYGVINSGTAYTSFATSVAAPNGSHISGIPTIVTNYLMAVGSDATGDMYYREATMGLLARLGIGADGAVMKSNGTIPTWSTITASDIEIAKLNTPTYTKFQDFINQAGSAGKISGGIITAVDVTHIAITEVTGLIRITNSANAELVSFNCAANSNFEISTGAVNYIYVDYNAGSPIFAATTTEANINRNTQIPIGAAYSDGLEAAHVFTDGVLLNNWITNEQKRLLEVRRAEHASGAELSEVATRNIAIASGVFYVAGTRAVLDAFNSSTGGTFKYVYSDGLGGWTYVASQTQIDNTYYDNGTGTLAEVGTAKYGVHWVFITPDGEVYVKYGIGSYSLAEAKAAQLPSSLPTEFSSFGIPCAKIIILKGASTFYEIISAWANIFGTEAPTNHNNLAGLQGGTTSEYYHLTAEEYTKLQLSQILFSQTADKTNTCDGTAQELIGTGVGTLVIGANTLNAGDTLHLTGSGIITATSGDSITLTLKLNDVVVYTYTGAAGASFTDTPYSNFGDIIVRTIGETGTVKMGGVRNIFAAIGFGTVTGLPMRGSATIDTTVDNTISIQYTAPVGASITAETFEIIRRKI